ncbi:GNAT family N-acetyltransferase [Spirosoma agri]|uniref:GNAT family N-acetyltransferase n=1 Tax=Spirosoma agri TaxID=1987381 RepID=A0A6M0IP34_9BACT|nr:GNAT family N-acetyltransferase [Spirosoma agri]NEU70008.1 GNAT family N-acetyltransferase [Spirosoma agri]
MNISVFPPLTKSVMLDDPYCIAEASFPEYIYDIGALRIRAWHDEPGVDATFFDRRTWIEPIDQTAQHWVVTRKNVVVAAARMSFHDTLDSVPYASLLPNSHWSLYTHKAIASINRLVVDPRFRGRGLARLLDQARIGMAIDKGVDVILAQPQISRLETLKKLNFSYVCELPRTPEMPNRPLFFMHRHL